MSVSDWLNQPYIATMGPLLTVSAAALIIMVLEFTCRKLDRRWLIGLALAGVAVALAEALVHFYHDPAMALNTVVTDAFANVFSVLILISALLVLLFALDYAGQVRLAGEHTYLILFAVAGALAMASAVDLITLYVGLELLSLSSYVLVALRSRSAASAEGGVKYLLMGSIGSAVLLYGMSFLYGVTGTTSLIQLGAGGLATYTSYPQIATLAFVLMLAGMGFKLSLVPFHMWTPDAYEGAPAPISAFLATLSKAAAFGMLLRMLLFIFNAAASDVFFWAGVLAAVTMVVGNLIALPQRNMKRLLAFSSVAQAGYVLLPFALFQTGAFQDWISLFDSLSFYLYAYTFMTVGAFAVVWVVSRARNTLLDEALVGLYQQSPWLALALTVFLLGLAGVPLTGGFVGKVYLFSDAVHLHAAWLGVLLFVCSVASFFYYFGWVRKVFQPLTGPLAGQRIHVGPSMNLLLAVCVAGTLLLGMVPALLLRPLAHTLWLS
ncbi:MAG: NADH-quinone oxidoreductase subunit N [Alicyclobacillus sp.]|nr:NADH-quinone oxidoreductase subunit N [Alicyclobacillus sp.]